MPLLRLSKNPSGRFGGLKPSKCNPNPATCAADSEALLCKVSLRRFPPGSPMGARGKRRKSRKRTPQADFFDTLNHPLGGWFLVCGKIADHHMVISFLPLILKNAARATMVENVRMAEIAEATPSFPRIICE